MATSQGSLPGRKHLNPGCARLRPRMPHVPEDTTDRHHWPTIAHIVLKAVFL